VAQGWFFRDTVVEKHSIRTVAGTRRVSSAVLHFFRNTIAKKSKNGTAFVSTCFCVFLDFCRKKNLFGKMDGERVWELHLETLSDKSRPSYERAIADYKDFVEEQAGEHVDFLIMKIY
jgi:hypothetical protein